MIPRSMLVWDYIEALKSAGIDLTLQGIVSTMSLPAMTQMKSFMALGVTTCSQVAAAMTCSMEGLVGIA